VVEFRFIAGERQVHRRDCHGWETVSFAAAVAILANTTYVASYYTSSGNYSYNGGYFATAGIDNAPLHAFG